MRRITTALALVALCPFAAACVVAAEAPAGPPVRVAVGDARLDFEQEAGIDHLLGPAFRTAVRGGADHCYLDALARDEHAAGEIAFVVKPPAGEGPFLVDLAPTGAIGAEVTDCVRKVFGEFYHYADHQRFDAIRGTLTFAPEWITAPALPTAAAVRGVIDKAYAQDDVVRVVGVHETDVSQWVEDSNTVLRNYRYNVDLEFTTDGYEADCQHNGPYKVFSRRPFDWSRWAGHSCESRRHKRGDHAQDDATVLYALTYWPEVAPSWELRGQPGTLRGTTSMR